MLWRNSSFKNPDSLRVFYPISQEQDFSQIKDLCRNTADNNNFNYRTKLMTKYFFKLKKPLFLAYFLPISPILVEKKAFPKIRLSCTTS